MSAPKKISSREGGRPKAAGVGPFPTSQPTPEPDGPCPSQEGIQTAFSFLPHTAQISGVGKSTFRVTAWQHAELPTANLASCCLLDPVHKSLHESETRQT